MNNPDVSDIGIILFMWCQKWMCQAVRSPAFLNFRGGGQNVVDGFM